jgi:hypothetical protein
LEILDIKLCEQVIDIAEHAKQHVLQADESKFLREKE